MHFEMDEQISSGQSLRLVIFGTSIKIFTGRGKGSSREAPQSATLHPIFFLCGNLFRNPFEDVNPEVLAECNQKGEALSATPKYQM